MTVRHQRRRQCVRRSRDDQRGWIHADCADHPIEGLRFTTRDPDPDALRAVPIDDVGDLRAHGHVDAGFASPPEDLVPESPTRQPHHGFRRQVHDGDFGTGPRESGGDLKPKGPRSLDEEPGPSLKGDAPEPLRVGSRADRDNPLRPPRQGARPRPDGEDDHGGENLLASGRHEMPAGSIDRRHLLMTPGDLPGCPRRPRR